MPKQELLKAVYKPSIMAKKVKKPAKKPTRLHLTKKLDEVFSKYIRQRNSYFKGGERVNICVTCGVELPVKSLQCGHYYSRGKFSTRWDEDNCHPQCYACNIKRSGNYTSYAMFMLDYLGEESLIELNHKSNTTKKYTLEELSNMIQFYTIQLTKVG